MGLSAWAATTFWMAASASIASKAVPATTYTIDSASEVLVEVSGIDLVRSTVSKTLATGFEN